MKSKNVMQRAHIFVISLSYGKPRGYWLPEMKYCEISQEMSSLSFGLNVFCQFESRVPEFDAVFSVQCTLYSPQLLWAGVAYQILGLLPQQNTASQKYNDNISFLISQKYHISDGYWYPNTDTDTSVPLYFLPSIHQLIPLSNFQSSNKVKWSNCGGKMALTPFN